MSKFGLAPDDVAYEGVDLAAEPTLAEKLSSFPSSPPRHRINIAAADEAAATHGFVSRENPVEQDFAPTSGRRRRIPHLEATRHLAIRVTAKQYDRFVAYADRHKLTYHDALARLLDQAND